MAWREDGTGYGAYPVTALIRPPARTIWQLTLLGAEGNREVFETTDDHPWHVGAYGTFLRTDALEAGMVLSTQDGDGVTVLTVDKTDNTAPTYNLTVGDAHTFFVGDDGIWVHNVDCTIGPNGFVDPRIEEAFNQFKRDNGLDISREEWVDPDSFVRVANSQRTGPGEWVSRNENSGVNAEWQEFQSSVTGAPPGTAYRAGGKNFDGIDPNSGELIDAKCYSCGDTGFPRNGFTDNLVVEDAVASARAATEAGRPLRCVVPSKEKADQLNDLFADNLDRFAGAIPPRVVWTGD